MNLSAVKKKFYAFALGAATSLALLFLLIFVIAKLPLRNMNDFSDSPEEYRKGHGAYGVVPQHPKPLPLHERKMRGPFNYFFEPVRAEGNPMAWDFVEDGTLYLPSPGKYRVQQKTISGKHIFDPTYVIDGAHRRVVPGTNPNATQFLLLLGDSYTFGWGVNPEENYAAQLAKKMPRFQVYNYGVPSLFPTELLLRLDRMKKTGEVSQKSGTAFFFYGSYSVFRNMGALHDVGNLGEKKPIFIENEKGEFVFQGNYREARPLWLWLGQLLKNLGVERGFRLILRTEPTAEDWQYEARLIKKIKEKAQLLGAKKFYVVLYPGPTPGLRARHAAQITAALESAQVDYIDFSEWDLRQLTRGAPLIFNDGHYTAEAHAVFADALYSVLKKILSP